MNYDDNVAIKALVGKHGVGAPEKAKWYVVCPKGPDECGDILGCIGVVGGKLDSANRALRDLEGMGCPPARGP